MEKFQGESIAIEETPSKEHEHSHSGNASDESQIRLKFRVEGAPRGSEVFIVAQKAEAFSQIKSKLATKFVFVFSPSLALSHTHERSCTHTLSISRTYVRSATRVDYYPLVVFPMNTTNPTNLVLTLC